jgi:hypothetical protein
MEYDRAATEMFLRAATRNHRALTLAPRQPIRARLVGTDSECRAIQAATPGSSLRPESALRLESALRPGSALRPTPKQLDAQCRRFFAIEHIPANSGFYRLSRRFGPSA